MTVYTVIGHITNAILTIEWLQIPSNLSGGPQLYFKYITSFISLKNTIFIFREDVTVPTSKYRNTSGAYIYANRAERNDKAKSCSTQQGYCCYRTKRQESRAETSKIYSSWIKLLPRRNN